jgi:hypothetical protein
VATRAELERALLEELKLWWAGLNHRLFDGRMNPPVLLLKDTGRQLGAWERGTRHLGLSRTLVQEASWGEVVEVLKHEMAHQYVDEVLRQTDETAHGPTFRAVCAERGIDGRAAGRVADTGEGSHERARVVGRIQKLLALADSPERNEAEAAMRAARRLLLKHNLSVAEARVEERYAWRQLGRPSGRIPTHERLLAGILGQHFFVSCVWVHAFDASRGRRGRVLEIAGTPENLEIASWVHGWLLETGERLWQAHRRARRLRSNSDRRRFLQGVMVGFHEKLEQENASCAETGLVWRGDAGLDGWVERRHLGLRAGRRTRVTTDAAWHEGRSAGQQIVLHKPVSAAAGPRGRRLTGE